MAMTPGMSCPVVWRIAMFCCMVSFLQVIACEYLHAMMHAGS
jgi:hypothetical protein